MSKTYANVSENNAYGNHYTPSKGRAKILVIPIWFASDSSTYISTSKKESVRSDIEKAYFGTNEETGWRSVKTYYEEESHGDLTLTGTVSEWYNETRSITSFTSESSGFSNSKALVSTVVEWYFTNNTSENRQDYDCNHDGILDGVMLIYGYPDYSSLNNDSYGNLWAYCYWTDNKMGNFSKPVVNPYFWASYDFMYSSSDAPSHTGTSQRIGDGDTSHCSIDAHTYIHEMGHMYGLDDYYDYSNSYSPAGGFSMQDNNVGGHDPFSSLSLGWGKAYIPTETTTITLKPFATTGEMILLSPEWNTFNSAFDEYLLIEFYTPTGLNKFDTDYQYKGYYPRGVNNLGIRLWHVDARLVFYNSNSVTSSNITTNPDYSCYYGVELAMSNTYNANGVNSGYLSPLGRNYYNYNVLQLIHNNTNASHKSTTEFSNSSLFKTGNSFSMSQYGRQFVNTGKFNSNTDLGFTFEVNSLSNESASITVTKI